MALLFGQMLRQDQNGQLLGDVKSSVPQSQPAAAKPKSALMYFGPSNVSYGSRPSGALHSC